LKICKCDERYKGSVCDECADGWSGADCSDQVVAPPHGVTPISKSGALTAITILSIIVACAMILGTAIFLLYRRFGQTRNYGQLELSDIDE